MRSRLALLSGLAVALLLPLTACGDRTADYCGDLESHSKEIADMIGSDSPTALLDGLPMLRDLADKAPDDMTDDWETYLGALGDLDKALDDADVKAEDFVDGKAPSGLSESDRTAIATAANQVASADVVAASTAIEQEARDVCKVNLGL